MPAMLLIAAGIPEAVPSPPASLPGPRFMLPLQHESVLASTENIVDNSL